MLASKLIEDSMEGRRETESYLALDNVALLEDLDDSVLLLSTAELGLKSALGGRVEGALVTVALEIC